MVISVMVPGKAGLTADEIVIASGARLGGELEVRSPMTPEIAVGANVAGPAARGEGQRHVVEAALRDRVGADPPRARPAWGHFTPSGTAETELPKWRLSDKRGARP